MFTQEKNDDFDWTRHSAATRDTKYTPNTGPSGDRTGSKQGKTQARGARDSYRTQIPLGSGTGPFRYSVPAK